MRISDMFDFSLENLRRRKGRTFLTVVGVIIGTCAILLMISLGIAANLSTNEMLQSWGDLSMIEVYGSNNGMGQNLLDDSAVESFKKMDNVLTASSIQQFSNMDAEIVAGKREEFISGGVWNVTGIEPDAIKDLGYELVSGSFLSGQSMGNNKIPVLVSELAAFDFYDSRKSWNHPDVMRSPYDESGALTTEGAFFDVSSEKLIFRMYYDYPEDGEAKYRDYELVIVGILKSIDSKGQNANGYIISTQDMGRLDAEYVKLSSNSSGIGNAASIRQKQQKKEYSTVYVKVDDINNVDRIENAIRLLGYETYSMNQIRTEMQAQVAQGQLMLGGLAAVSLLVAALNIANTMTMAIQERIKEIGVMKVLGCKLSNIRAMFLIESGFIGFIGGALGCVLGFVLSTLLNHLPYIFAETGMEQGGILTMFGFSNMAIGAENVQISLIPVWLFGAALLFSTFIGILSGIIPSKNAVKISALEAMRYN